MTPPDKNVISALNAADWEDIAPKLHRFVICLMAEKTIDQLPEGKTAGDLADAIVHEVYTGQRKWDPDKHPNLLVHLKWIAKSKLSGKGLLGRKKDPLSYTDSDDELDALSQSAETKPNMREESAFTQALYEEIADDKDLQDIVVAIEMGCSTSRDIAREAGLTPDRVYELRRKLHGRALKARQRLQDSLKKEGPQ